MEQWYSWMPTGAARLTLVSMDGWTATTLSVPALLQSSVSSIIGPAEWVYLLEIKLCDYS